MSGELDDCLDQIVQSSESISTLYFKPPGIFHNAIVPDPNTSYADIITRIIRDGDPQEEVSLYKVSKEGLPKRKDDKMGVFDFLTEHEGNLKRNRRVGSPEQSPVIHVPKEFYLKQHEQEAKLSQRHDNYTLDGFKTDGLFQVLLKKFENDAQVRDLLHALQNGTVFTGEGDENIENRRRTLFVEDFPVELIFKVIHEIVTNWPVSEHQKTYSDLLQRYKEMDSEIRQLRAQAKEQESTLNARQMSSGVSKIIQKERQEVQKLQQTLESLQNR